MTVFIIIIAIVLFFGLFGCLSAHKGTVGDVANIIYWLLKKLWVIFVFLLAIVVVFAIIMFLITWFS